MSNVINLADRMARRPPIWGASVTIAPDATDGRAKAELTQFWGDDPDREAADRCRLFADALFDLVCELRETANLLDEAP